MLLSFGFGGRIAWGEGTANCGATVGTVAVFTKDSDEIPAPPFPLELQQSNINTVNDSLIFRNDSLIFRTKMDLRDYKALSPQFKNEESEVSHTVHG